MTGFEWRRLISASQAGRLLAEILSPEARCFNGNLRRILLFKQLDNVQNL